MCRIYFCMDNFFLRFRMGCLLRVCLQHFSVCFSFRFILFFYVSLDLGLLCRFRSRWRLFGVLNRNSLLISRMVCIRCSLSLSLLSSLLTSKSLFFWKCFSLIQSIQCFIFRFCLWSVRICLLRLNWRFWFWRSRWFHDMRLLWLFFNFFRPWIFFRLSVLQLSFGLLSFGLASVLVLLGSSLLRRSLCLFRKSLYCLFLWLISYFCLLINLLLSFLLRCLNSFFRC